MADEMSPMVPFCAEAGRGPVAGGRSRCQRDPVPWERFFLRHHRFIDARILRTLLSLGLSPNTDLLDGVRLGVVEALVRGPAPPEGEDTGDFLPRLGRLIRRKACGRVHTKGGGGPAGGDPDRADEASPPPCAAYPPIFFDDHVDGLLDEETRVRFEAHLSVCPACTKGVTLARMAARTAERCYPLSEGGQRRALQATLVRLEKLMRRMPQTALLLSGSMERPGKTGVAYGVAVDPEAGSGELIECAAWVGEVTGGTGALDIRGVEVEAMRRNDVEVTITSPLDLLEQQIADLFVTHPFLRNLSLHRREITVDLSHTHGSGYILEAQSLGLAVLVAILNALEGREQLPRTVFSARIRKGGELQRVGDLELKIAVAKNLGVEDIILCEKNIHDFEEGLPEGNGVRLLFFSRLGEVLDHLGLLGGQGQGAGGDFIPGLFPAGEGAGDALKRWGFGDLDTPWASLAAQRAGEEYIRRVEGWRFVVEKAASLGIRTEFCIALCEMAEDLSQFKIEGKPISTALLVGDLDRASAVLGNAPLKLLQREEEDMAERVVALSSIVDGMSLGFLLGLDGTLHAIVRVDVDPGIGAPASPLLDGIDRRYAVLSRTTGALIFFVTPAGNHVKVYCDGEIMGRYVNGDWRPTDYNAFEKALVDVGVEKGVSPDIVRKVGRTAIKMSECNRGGIFAFFSRPEAIQGLYRDNLPQLSVCLDRVFLGDMSDGELINFAKEDGAVLVDVNGYLHSFKAFLDPKAVGALSWPVTGTRHFSARAFSEDTGCFCVVVSVDGGVSLFSAGAEISRI